jgi:UDP-N-acetylglucosamine 2-epimerase (non-hydrolysing)
VLVLRNTTERPEGIAANTLKLIGTKQKNIYEEVSKLLTDTEAYKYMSEAVNPYGDGLASRHIADAIEKRFSK